MIMKQEVPSASLDLLSDLSSLHSFPNALSLFLASLMFD
jgi:hypothetical protein